MKNAGAKRLLSFIIVAVMLVSGMCLEYVEADSLFVNAVNENNTVVLTSAKDIPVNQMLCTNEMLGRQKLEFREVQIRSNQGKSVIRAGMGLPSLEVLPKILILTKLIVMEAANHKPCGKEIIIAYIHHQDGAKG